MQRSRPDIAGRYADLARYVRTETGRHEFPSPAEIPALMGDFAEWLRGTPATAKAAFTAHLRLVSIHPFNDGNWRSARLFALRATGRDVGRVSEGLAGGAAEPLSRVQE